MNNHEAERQTYGDATISIHAGETERKVGDPVNFPPMMSTSFYSHPDAVGFSATDLGENAPHFYTRWTNPTLELLERRLATLEQGEAAVSFSSGMAAISAVFLHCLKAGDHFILSDVCYAGTSELARDILPSLGIEVTRVDTSNLDAVAAAMRPNTRLVHVETPANPTLKLSDVEAIAKIVHAGGAELSVDSTIGTPLGIRPLLLGSDYAIHSLTKYLSGHGDLLGGVVIGDAERMARLRQQSLIHLGGNLSPFSAWLTLRGLETLKPRMLLHESNARQIEEYLAEHPLIRSVLWPGSPRHPQYELAIRQMKNFSGLLSFTVKENSEEIARRLAERMKVFSYAVSLGKTKSLLYYIPTQGILRSSFDMDEASTRDYRTWAGEGVFRVSVGLEDAEDLIADLDQALS